jgi:hypothetical protein
MIYEGGVDNFQLKSVGAFQPEQDGRACYDKGDHPPKKLDQHLLL